MIAKELIEARWKALVGAIVGALLIIASLSAYDLLKDMLSTQASQIPSTFQDQIMDTFSNFGLYAFALTFSPTNNNGVVLLIVAALLGASFVAGEVSKGSIFLLLSRPLSRERIILTKYAVGAGVLLAMVVFAGGLVLVLAAITGHSLDVGGVAISVLLYWLGLLFVLGVSTLASVLSSDVLRPLAITLGLVLLLSVPGFFPNGSDWVLPAYWSSVPAFLGQEFPTRALIISLVAAALPAAAAVPLFKRQAY